MTGMLTNDSFDEPQKKIPRVDNMLQTHQPRISIDAHAGLLKEIKREPVIANAKDHIYTGKSKIDNAVGSEKDFTEGDTTQFQSEGFQTIEPPANKKRKKSLWEKTVSKAGREPRIPTLQ